MKKKSILPAKEVKRILRDAGYGKVIHCKDCKYAKINEDGEIVYCKWLKTPKGEKVELLMDAREHYCSLAVRREQ